MPHSKNHTGLIYGTQMPLTDNLLTKFLSLCYQKLISHASCGTILHEVTCLFFIHQFLGKGLKYQIYVILRTDISIKKWPDYCFKTTCMSYYNLNFMKMLMLMMCIF